MLDDVVKDPQMRAAEAFVKMDYPGAGVLETVNSPVFVSGVEKRKPTAAAEVGAHTREVLQELGYSAEAIDSITRDRRSALARFLAAPPLPPRDDSGISWKVGFRQMRNVKAKRKHSDSFDTRSLKERRRQDAFHVVYGTGVPL